MASFSERLRALADRITGREGDSDCFVAVKLALVLAASLTAVGVTVWLLSDTGLANSFLDAAHRNQEAPDAAPVSWLLVVLVLVCLALAFGGD